MANREKITYLSQYVNLGKEYDEILQSYEYFKYKITSVQAQRLTDMPKGGGANDKISGNIAKLEELEDIIDSKLNKLIRYRAEVENAIGCVDGDVSDSIHRRILNLRYIDGLEWEEICGKINYSWVHTHRLHNESLEKIRI